MQLAAKKRIALFFGGVSSEHEVSRVSAAGIVENIDRDLFDLLAIGITKNGRWLLTPANPDDMRSGAWESSPFNIPCTVLMDREDPGLLLLGDAAPEKVSVDCAFPVLHGKNGEDGTIQGLFEMAGIPYAGCGVAASANCMDKALTKLAAAPAGVRQARARIVYRADVREDPEALVSSLLSEFMLPVFVKPAHTGSSVGVSKASDEMSLAAALALASLYDEKIVVEEFIDGLELEVAVLGNGNPVASAVGRIVSAADFYDYDSKYNNAASRLIIPADISDADAAKLRAAALDIFKALGCRGLSRVDFFLTRFGEVVFNEVNTMPGFTPISMYPKLFDAIGIPYKELITYIVELALEDSEEQN